MPAADNQNQDDEASSSQSELNEEEDDEEAEEEVFEVRIQLEEQQAQIDNIHEILIEDRLNNIENIRRDALDQDHEN